MFVCLTHSEELGVFMESRGACTPGILTLTTGLSKPFVRLDKYPTLLKELERHMEARWQTFTIDSHITIDPFLYKTLNFYLDNML